MNKGVISVLSGLAGVVIGGGIVGRSTLPQIDKNKGYADKHLALYLMMNQWVKVKQEGKNLSSYFEKKGYKKIAVYGMSYAGETLLDELKDTNVEVLYGIDKNANGIYADIDIMTLDDTLEDVDAVVVTAVTFFSEIEEQLQEKLDCPIISLEDVLYEV